MKNASSLGQAGHLAAIYGERKKVRKRERRKKEEGGEVSIYQLQLPHSCLIATLSKQTLTCAVYVLPRIVSTEDIVLLLLLRANGIRKGAIHLVLVRTSGAAIARIIRFSVVMHAQRLSQQQIPTSRAEAHRGCGLLVEMDSR